MSVSDDRAKFAEEAVLDSLRMGEDEELYAASRDFLLTADKYRYSYLWTWMGAPIIQMPADVMTTQAVIWQTKPDVIIETGVARGGSMIFMASMLELIGNGIVIGVDIDIRAHNRETIESHPMSKRVRLIEGSSVASETLDKVRALIPNGARVMVVLDSDHSRAHVLAELRAYGPLVTRDCYLVIADTLVGHLTEEQAPKLRSQILSKGNDPLTARDDYLAETTRFEVDKVVNGKLILSSSPGGYLKCVQD